MDLTGKVDAREFLIDQNLVKRHEGERKIITYFRDNIGRKQRERDTYSRKNTGLKIKLFFF